MIIVNKLEKEKRFDRITKNKVDLIIDLDDDSNITVETTIEDKTELTKRIKENIQNRINVYELLGIKEIAEKWKKAAIDTGIIKAKN